MVSRRRRRTPGRPAGDGQELVRTVLDATVRQLGQKGFVGLSVEEVARDAGVNKTSVYRRWPSKAELVAAALQAVGAKEPPFEESGDLRQNLICILRRKVAVLTDPHGQKIARALLVLNEDGEAAAFARSIRERQNVLLIRVLQSAIDRGELSCDASPSFLAELLLAPVVYRALVIGTQVDDRYIETIVDYLLRAIGASPAHLSSQVPRSRR
jgi:AcrR family transcriptional regulator